MRGFGNVTTATVLLAAVAPAFAQQAVGTVPVTNPGFEGEYRPVASSSDAPGAKAKITGAIAQGWSDNSNWADVDVDFARDTANPHRGESSQRVQVTRVAGGAVQLVQRVPLKKGRVHRLRVWMRGQPGTIVSVSLRQAPAPYREYVTQGVSLAAEWQEFSVFAPIPEDTDGFIMIRATQPMTFWIDDVTLEDLTEAQSDAPARVGNLIPSGGAFEAGMPFGWSVRYQGSMANRYADPRPVIDRTAAKQGKASLRCDIPAGDNVRIASPLFDYNFNRPHAISLWLRAARPNTNVLIEMEKAGIGRSFAVGTEWQRVTLTGMPSFLLGTRLRLNAAAGKTEGNTLWIDGVQVEERAEPSADYAATHPVELSLTLPLPGHVAFVGEKAAVRIETAGTLPPGAHLSLTAVDLAGKAYALPPVALPAASFPLPDFGGRRGMWKLTATVVHPKGVKGPPLSAPFELIWSRLPRPVEIDPKQSYFGNHISLTPRYIDLVRRIGTRRVRLHDTSMIGKWAVAEPEPGKFEFHDAGVTAASKAGLSILGMLDGAPGWASTKPREAGYWSLWHIPDAPGAMEKWENYVRTVAGHYKGRIDEWEVWNEPWGKWFRGADGPPELYGQLMSTAYRALKETNPKATLVGVDTYRTHESWTEGVLKSAGPSNYDAFSFHDYNDALYAGPDSLPFTQARAFREVQAKYGAPKPLWNTEGGLFGVGSWYAPSTGGMDVTLQPAYIVRYDVSYMAAGVRNFYLYAIHTDGMHGETETRVTEHDNAVKPILAARAVLASLVDGAGTPKRSEPVEGVEAYAYPAQKGRTVTVLWSLDGATHRLSVPHGAQALDIWSNPLPVDKGVVTVGVEPVYFLAGATAGSQAKR